MGYYINAERSYIFSWEGVLADKYKSEEVEIEYKKSDRVYYLKAGVKLVFRKDPWVESISLKKYYDNNRVSSNDRNEIEENNMVIFTR